MLLSRAVDDSGNLEDPAPGGSLTLGAPLRSCAGRPGPRCRERLVRRQPLRKYLCEILRTEGLMLFDELEVGFLQEGRPRGVPSRVPHVLLAETRLFPSPAGTGAEFRGRRRKPHRHAPRPRDR